MNTCRPASRFAGTRISVSAYLLAFAAMGTLVAQERFGELNGTVTDPSGAVLPNVEVKITNKGTARVVNTQTGPSGQYVARNLEPGHYSVRFEAAGFTTFEVADVNLLVGKAFTVNAPLTIARAEQSVVITESAPLIDVTNSAQAHNITAEEFDRLPKARSFQNLAALSTSVNTGEVEGGIQVNGASGAENNFVIDGVSTTSLLNGQSRQGAVFEILQEVQVKSGGISAEYGGALGGVVSAISKSGGNSFHGDVHYYLSGNKLNAAPRKRLLLSPTDDVTTRFWQDTKQKADRHELGYSLGGYFIKNRLYFFSAASPQWRRRSSDILFSNGKEPSTIESKSVNHMLFEKLSFDITQKLRGSVQWYWTPTIETGTIPGFNGECPNCNTSDLKSNSIRGKQGFFAPQSNYNAQLDYVATPTTLLSVRAGRFWDNFKDTGIPDITSVTYRTSATNLPITIPAELRQPINFFNTPRIQPSLYDIVARTYVQGDVSRFFRALGSHDFKAGVGTQKNVNRVNVDYPTGGFIYIFWDRAFNSLVPGGPRNARGTYGYLRVSRDPDEGIHGRQPEQLLLQRHVASDPAAEPQYRIPLGERARAVVPAQRQGLRVRLPVGRQVRSASRRFVRHVRKRQGQAVRKLGPLLRLGEVRTGSRHLRRRVLARSLSFARHAGCVLAQQPESSRPRPVESRRSRFVPQSARARFRHDRSQDQAIKPMSSDLMNFGTEIQIAPQTVFRAAYVRNHLRRTIEDLGVLVNGDEVYYYANPGEGSATTTPPSGSSKPFPTPKPVRNYDGAEFQVTKRFGNWFGSASYVYSRLYGNYPGLASSDEIRTGADGLGVFGADQEPSTQIFRPGGNANRAWDIDELLWDSKGNLDPKGRLATDRPHVFKLFGSKTFKWGDRQSSDAGVFFSASSGTPLSTFVNTVNGTQIFVNGRGDLGRTPFLTQTNLVVGHEVKVGEGKRLRFEFNAENLFNQKTSRHRWTELNRARASAEIDLHDIDLAKGYDFRALLNGTEEGAKSLTPLFGLDDWFNPGFAGRLQVKFIF